MSNAFAGEFCQQCGAFVLDIIKKYYIHQCAFLNRPVENNEISFEEALIMQVKVRRPLWNHKMPVIKRSKAIKKKLWIEIHQKLNAKYDVKTLKKKWKYLKDEYIWRKKALKSSKEDTKEWVHMKRLRFLDDIVVKKPTSSSMMEMNENTELIDPSTATREKRSSSVEENINVLTNELKTKTVIQQPISSDKKFGEYLVSIMADLPKKKKLKLQAQFIAQVLSETDLSD